MDSVNLTPFFRSVLEQDRALIVLCDLHHTILYCNPAAKEKFHGDLTGRNLFECHNERSRELITRVVDWFGTDVSHNIVFTHHKESGNRDIYMVALRDEANRLIGYYEKQEFRTPETVPAYQMPD